MDFEFTPEQLEFVKDVEQFLDDNHDPEVFDLTRENMAQIVDTPKRRQFMAKLGEKGWLGITWPEEYGGKDGDGVYEYLLNEALAARGGPQIGKGVGIIGKTIISHGSETMKAEFLPKILKNEVEFAVGYSEPNAGSDAASMQLKATKVDGGWMLNGQKTWTTSAHFADWYWVGARTDPDAPKHNGITLFLVPMDHPGITVKAIWTMGDERTNEVYLDDVFVPDDYVVGELNRGFQYISEALDLERFTLFTYSPIAQRLDLLTGYVKGADAGRRADEGRSAGALAGGPSPHRGRGRPGARAQVRGGVDGRRCAAHLAGLGVQALHHRVLAPPGQRLDGPGRCGRPAAGPHRGGPHGRPRRVDVPVHGHRHHRGRLVRGAEEHPGPTQARPAQELLIPPTPVPAPPATCSAAPPGTGPAAPGGPLAGVTVLDLASVGPAARCTRVLADYGATVVKVGAVPGRGVEPLRPPFYAYSGARHLRHVAVDLKDPDGRDAFLALVRGADVVVESFRPGVVDRLGVGFADLVAVNPRVILCSTTGYGQDGPRAAWAGHDINYLAVGGYLASTEPAGDGGPPVSGATIADAAGGGMQAAMAVMAALVGRGTDGPGVHLDVSIADGVLWLTSLAVDEYLATGAPVGFGHNIITGRYACYDTYRCADGRWLAVGAIEPKFFANLCRLLGLDAWIGRERDDAAQDGLRAAFAAAFATRDRDSWVAELAAADTCVSPVLSVEELVDDEQYAARRAIVEADVAPGRTDGAPPTFRQVGPVLAGMAGAGDRVAAGDAARSDADELLCAAGVPAERIAAWREKGVVA